MPNAMWLKKRIGIAKNFFNIELKENDRDAYKNDCEP